ncbi:hypothetical protein [Bacteriovorax sp. DB6_IX]|uniref:hypothetical protein n=1 Tax=Bacteriovorax sp. DB6_IX TaxID=1353530 RepID=UPI00038A1522|nr:hypothetical protein [Bacteriovorax sp. DB6_IX]EQC50456.1 hypothetical protein M901_0942 [Bacteriovorax sp. DB6_IX]
MLKIQNTVLTALTFLALSFSAQAVAQDGKPCNEGNLNPLSEEQDKLIGGLARSNSILTYPETKVLCETILNMGSGETTLGFIKKYSRKLPSKSSKEFLSTYGSSITCYGRSLIYFTLYKGHDDDLKALLDAGHDVNDIIEDTRGRRMTMLDYIRIVYDEETNPIYKDLIKQKIKRIRKAGGKTCSQLSKECILKV